MELYYLCSENKGADQKKIGLEDCDCPILNYTILIGIKLGLHLSLEL